MSKKQVTENAADAIVVSQEVVDQIAQVIMKAISKALEPSASCQPVPAF